VGDGTEPGSSKIASPTCPRLDWQSPTKNAANTSPICTEALFEFIVDAPFLPSAVLN
jgi:hypothetical protein